MRKILLILPLLIILSFLASAQTTVHYFYGDGCPHCANVDASGVLEKVADLPSVKLEKHDVKEPIYATMREQFNISIGWPLAIIQCNETTFYIQGDKPIINNLEDAIKTCSYSEEKISWIKGLANFFEEKFKENLNSQTGRLSLFGWIILILSAVLDSINPCAFGVLIFLMLTLLRIESRKRALKAGLLYSFVVFIVYFLAGLGIFKIIQSFTSITHYIYLAAGILVLIAGILEVKDFFFYGKFLSLKIPDFAKPIIEKLTHHATSIPVIILLGIVVSLFELPCTGGIYLAIISILSKFKVLPIFYLFIYNLIFILPLIILTLIMYHGTKPEVLQKWTAAEKKWMRLFTGLIMIALGLYILLF